MTQVLLTAMLNPEDLLALADDPDTQIPELRAAVAGTYFGRFAKPLTHIPQARWVEMFRRCGYFSVGDYVPQPTAPLRLYRGAREGWERGLSWTTSPAYASNYDFPLWTVLAPPESILALYTIGNFTGQNPDEYLVDLPHDVAVEEHTESGQRVGVILHFRGRSVEAVERHVQRFLHDTGLQGLRKAALGWTVLSTRQGDEFARVQFGGHWHVIPEVAARYERWRGRVGS